MEYVEWVLLQNGSPFTISKSEALPHSCSFGSTWDCRPYGCSGLPRPSGSALVGHHSDFAMDLRAFVCDLSFHPFASVRFLLPFSSALVFSRTASTSVLWRPGSTSVIHRCSSVLVSRTFSVLGIYSFSALTQSPPSKLSKVHRSLVPPGKAPPWLLPRLCHGPAHWYFCGGLFCLPIGFYHLHLHPGFSCPCLHPAFSLRPSSCCPASRLCVPHLSHLPLLDLMSHECSVLFGFVLVFLIWPVPEFFLFNKH